MAFAIRCGMVKVFNDDQAIHQLKKTCTCEKCEKDTCSIFRAIKALEKRVGRDPFIKIEKIGNVEMENLKWWRCPDCDCLYDYEEQYDFCPICGQRLKWDGEEDEQN